MRHGVTLATTRVPKLDSFTITEGRDREVLGNLRVGPVPLNVNGVLDIGLSHERIQLVLTIFEELGLGTLRVELSANEVQDVTTSVFGAASIFSLREAFFGVRTLIPSLCLYPDLLIGG